MSPPGMEAVEVIVLLTSKDQQTIPRRVFLLNSRNVGLQLVPEEYVMTAFDKELSKEAISSATAEAAALKHFGKCRPAATRKSLHALDLRCGGLKTEPWGYDRSTSHVCSAFTSKKREVYVLIFLDVLNELYSTFSPKLNRYYL